jgi:hypothetical protein
MRREEQEKSGLIQVLKEDRYVLVVAIAMIIFFSASSLAIMTNASEVMSPVEFAGANTSTGAVELYWSASKSTGMLGYDVYRSEAAGTLGQKLTKAPVLTLGYMDSPKPGNYYYTIRTVGPYGDDKNTRQLQVLLSDIIPSDVMISINGGAQYSKSLSVELALHASGAALCRLKNDMAASWGPWEDYSASKEWTLSTGNDGDRIVAFQCRNTGESDIALARVTVDRKPPVPDFKITIGNGSAVLELDVADALSPSVGCKVDMDGSPTAAPLQLEKGAASTALSYRLTQGQHSVSVSCTDEAGNTGVAQQEFSVQ